jgi:DnaK suppressor protein
MDKSFLKKMEDRLQRERHDLIAEASAREQRSKQLAGDLQAEREEHAQSDIAAEITETIKERQQDRISEIDAALARIEAGTYGQCQNCGRFIEEARLEADPATALCGECAGARPEASESETEENHPEGGRLPPDLEGLDDEELAERLQEIVRSDGQVDMQELQIIARNHVVYLEGSVPSEPERAILANILTDVAGVQDIVDHLEVQRLAWEREDRWKEEDTQDVLPGTVPDQEPYGGTDDVVLTEEEGVTYEPPENPPPPPNRKD